MVAPLLHHSNKKSRFPGNIYLNGGANRDRTGDLLVANETLSQLSYGPNAIKSYQKGVRLSINKLKNDLIFIHEIGQFHTGICGAGRG